MSATQTQTWVPPRPKAEILLVTPEQASEYVTWFVNRKAYTKQKHRPDPETGRYQFRQAKDYGKKPPEPLALDRTKVLKHLQGYHTIGLYAINPLTQCSKWVAIDADYGEAYRDLRALKVELEKDGVEAIVEMSRRGAHLWILCAEPLPARLCKIYIYNLALRLGVPIKGVLKQVDGIEVFPRQEELEADQFGNAIRAPLGVHRANVHRYWFEEASSNLTAQFDYLRRVKRLTAAELESFTDGVPMLEVAVSHRPTEQPNYNTSKPGFQILRHVEVRSRASGNYVAQCPSCASQGRDRARDNLHILIKDPNFYVCRAHCTKEMIREALGQPIPVRSFR